MLDENCPDCGTEFWRWTRRRGAIMLLDQRTQALGKSALQCARSIKVLHPFVPHWPCVLGPEQLFFPNAWQGFPTHSGGLGVEGVFARRCVYARNRSQPSAWGPHGRAYGKFCKRCHFWRFQTSRCFVSRGVALRDIQTCFVTCQKSFCVAGTILLRRFGKMSFRGRRSTLDASIVILRGRRSTLDVSCCVLFANRIVRAASSAARCKFRGRRGILWDVTKNWRKPGAKHRFWGGKFRGS